MRTLPIALLALLAAACGSPSAPASTSDETKFEMGIASQIAFDVTKLKRGDRSFYTVKLLGSPKVDYVTFAVVEEDADSIWIENTVPADPRPFVIKSKYRRKTGELLERWAGEPHSEMPAKLYPREGKKTDPVTHRDPGTAHPEMKEDVDSITVAGKTWTATRVTTSLAYPDGRKSVLTDWYHKDVPFSVVIKTGTPNERSYGGLVKRQFGRMTMELLRWDNKATPDLIIPKEEKK